MPTLAAALVLALVAPQWVETETARLKASDPAVANDFGGAVALQGNTAVVGAHTTHVGGANWAGAVYVFDRNQGGWGAWGEIRKITAPTPLASGDFGRALAFSGDTLVVAEKNNETVYIFDRNQGGPNAWGLVASSWAMDGERGDVFGTSVALHSDTLIVGAPGDDHAGGVNAGSAYVFERDQGGPDNWGEVAKLVAPAAAADERFGASVALEGDTVLVGVPWDARAGIRTGSAHLFERNQGGSGVWGHIANLIASDAAAYNLFGAAVALGDDVATVGAPENDNAGGIDAGAAYVFERDNGGPGAWGESTKLVAPDGQADDELGTSVVVLGDQVLIGAGRDDDPLEDSGSVYTFARDQGGPGAWGQTAKLGPKVPLQYHRFGSSADASGDTALVGAPLVDRGSAYVFQTLAGEIYCTAGTSASGCTASLSPVGTPSATADSGFLARADGIEGPSNGLFFFGSNGRQAAPWGNGFQCVVPPVKRGPAMPGVGTFGVCDGAFAYDLNALWCPVCPKATKNPGAGAVVQLQLWYRDPFNPTNQWTNFSNAIEFVVAP